TGKEGAAFFIHELSKRRDYPFITLNCSGFTETILDSELFGYTPGTMTDGLKGGKEGIVHEAQNGTLFLDELPDMSPTLQGKLLRFAQTGEYRQVGGTKKEYLNVRIVAAGQPALLQGVRPDLLARLSRLELQIPPLKKMEAESPGTIMKIANSLLEEQTWETVWDDKKREEIVLTPQDIGKKKEELQSKYEEQLKKAPWKNSNIRELLNAIECWIRFGDNGMNEYLQGQTEDTNSNIKNNTTFAILLQAAVDSVALDDLPKIFTETKNNKGLKLHDHLHHHYFKAVRDYRGTAVEPVIIGKLTGTNKRTVIKFLNG
ncbi:MAG: sigma-54-dependent Fis family transcriptional regulator, partial [Desulfobulbaceae bacterium]|nr:sigma-54-dependent Fis family transcriptional regulator [Desulfobulbaceae bacterium]